MTPFIHFQHGTDIMRHETGVVVPVYLPPDVDTDMGERLLRDNVATFIQQVAEPSSICLCVDGLECGLDAARAIADDYNTKISCAPENKGKLNAVFHGMQTLLEDTHFRYLAIVDQDGDHFGNELLNAVRSAEHITSHICSDRVMVLGQRRSRHRPMGFLRGELEELADRVLMDVLLYRATITDKPLRLEYTLLMDEYPDFHSGFKLFDRATAESIFQSKPDLAGVSESCYFRHGVESVLTVEALEAGAYLGAFTRSTVNEQPLTTFGLFNRIQLVADKIIWPSRRLKIPHHFIRQWMANHMPRLLLSTMVPEGKDELIKIRDAVLEGIGDTTAEDELLFQPLFV
ncbi:MAG: hypothetical protein VYA69_11685 [Gemmatimonadota bacterium]|nr:hypothetical protein [Gemmatimonadota bacterium]